MEALTKTLVTDHQRWRGIHRWTAGLHRRPADLGAVGLAVAALVTIALAGSLVVSSWPHEGTPRPVMLAPIPRVSGTAGPQPQRPEQTEGPGLADPSLASGPQPGPLPSPSPAPGQPPTPSRIAAMGSAQPLLTPQPPSVCPPPVPPTDSPSPSPSHGRGRPSRSPKAPS